MRRVLYLLLCLWYPLFSMGQAVRISDKPDQFMTDVQKLMATGYTSITEFEADDGHWEGEGVKNGATMQFHADPKTGAILSEKPNK